MIDVDSNAALGFLTDKGIVMGRKDIRGTPSAEARMQGYPDAGSLEHLLTGKHQDLANA